MSKRFTETDKWKDPWFCGLSTINKLFWIYLLDNCDHAGIWNVNWPLVKFYLGKTYSNADLKPFAGRISYLSTDKWFLPKFLIFQYGELNPQNRVHNSVISILEKEGAYKGLNSPMEGATYTDKDKDKDNTTTDLKTKIGFAEYVFMTQGQYDQLAQKLGITVLNSYVERLNNYIGSQGKKYKSHYHTILSWCARDGGTKPTSSTPKRTKEDIENEEFETKRKQWEREKNERV